MGSIESVLRFDKYVVDEVLFKTNHTYKDNNEPVKVSFSIGKEIEHEADGKMVVSLIVNIFQNSEENNFPFEMIVKVSGFFTMSDSSLNLDSNAIAILYPYVRSIVSVYTSNVNVPQLILPVINVNALIEQMENKKAE